MNTLKLKAHVGDDGILHLAAPVGATNIDCEVTVTYELSMSQEEWLRFLDETYGSLADDPIERLPQGEVEHRDPIR
jgi:hypothetical protein